MVDPWPRGSGNRNIAYNGQKMQAAVERYRTDRVIPPTSATTSVFEAGARGGGPAARRAGRRSGGNDGGAIRLTMTSRAADPAAQAKMVVVTADAIFEDLVRSTFGASARSGSISFRRGSPIAPMRCRSTVRRS